MPALFTHYKLGAEVLEKVYTKLQEEIKENRKYYDMFNQGWDNIFYYPIHQKYYKNFGIDAHYEQVDEFFKNMINYIKDNNLENDSNLTNMVYGFINHYTMDTIIHPFINYQVKNIKIAHTKIEFIIDTQLRENKSNKLFNTTIPRLKFNKNLTNLIDYTFLKTHNQNNIGKIFNISHNISYYLYRYFITDKYGIKSFIYKIVDKLIPFKDLKFYELTYYVKNYDKEFYNKLFNREKLNWHHPDNKNEIYNYSFEELYNITLTISTKLNNLAYEVLHKNGNIDELISLIKLINFKNIKELLH